MQASSLFIQPADAQPEPPPREVVERVLRRRGVIGEPLDRRRFAAGDGLLAEIGFTGCSVAVKLEPAADDDQDYCHLVMLGPYPQTQPFTGENTVKPRCPECGERLIDWQRLIEDWQGEGTEPSWSCPRCRSRTRASRLRWRRHAAFGRLLIEIRHVFPAEAVPHDALLEALEKATGVAWDYAWAGSSA